MSHVGYDLMDDSLRTQNDMNRTSLEPDEAHGDTEDMYLAPSPMRDTSEPPTASDSQTVRSMTPLFMEPGEAHKANNIEWTSRKEDEVLAEKPQTRIVVESTEVGIVDTMNFTKLDDEGDLHNVVSPDDNPYVKEENTPAWEWPWNDASTRIVDLTDDEHDTSSLKMPIGEVNIKEENNLASQWTWKNTSKEVIVITDDEHDASSMPIRGIHINEENNLAWQKNASTEAIVIIDNEHDTPSQLAASMAVDEGNNQAENDLAFEWRRKNASTDAIFVADDQHETSSHPDVQMHDVRTGFASATTSNNVPPKNALVHKRNQHRRPTAANILKMEEAQRAYAEKATGRRPIGAVGNLFKGVHTVQPPAATHTPQEFSDNDWMNLEISDADEDQAEIFCQIKKKYNARKKTNENNEEDDVLFLRAANAEKLRLSKIEKERVCQKDQDDAGILGFFSGNAEGLVGKAGLNEVSSLKRSFETTSESALVGLDPEGANLLRRLQWNASLSPKKRRRHGVFNPVSSELKATMKEGPATTGEKNKMRSNRGTKTRTTGLAKTRKSKKSNISDIEETQIPHKEKKSKKGTAYQETNKIDFASLAGRDIIADAQTNANKGDQPSFTDHRKRQALNELVASLPQETRRIHQTDKTALLKATQSFNGRGAMKADGKGGWRLKGMESSLNHYQLLGAAFMRNRENGQNEPLGGILADEMGFGYDIHLFFSSQC